MKNLSNVSPFLMLLLPVFFAMITSISFATKKENEEVVLKTKSTSTGVIIKATKYFVK